MWDLKNSYGQVPREIIDTGLDAGQRPTEWKLWKPPTSILPTQDGSLTLLPVFTHKSLKAIKVKSSDWQTTYIVNLCDYTCSSPRCVEKHLGVPPRDFGRLCKHIILALREKHLEAQLPPIARGIADNGYPEAFGVNCGRFATDLNGDPIYVTAPNSSGWLSVFALIRRGGVTYYRWGYNTRTNEWTFTDGLGMNCYHINRNGERFNIPKPRIHESSLV